jgi:hypothetical protein
MSKRRGPLRRLAVVSVAALCFCSAARAQSLSDTLSVDNPTVYFGNYEVRLEGFASGTLFAGSQDSGPSYPDGFDDSGATGVALASFRVQRIHDSGLITGMRANFLLAHDSLSGDNYGNNALQKIYFYVQSGIGRLEIGQQDGAAYTLGFSGPQVDPHVSLENPDSYLFRNPITRDAFNSFTREITSVQTSSNAAKISVISPRLFGVQIGASYTPDLLKGPVPYLFGNPKNGPNVQASIWEFAATYTRRLGDIDAGISAAYSRGALRNPTPGSGDIYDWAIGLQFQAEIFDDVDLSWGGGYRASSGYGFAPSTVYHNAESERVFLSAMAEMESWRLGAEYSNTYLDAAIGVPTFAVDGFQATLGYVLNDNWQLSGGWQFYNYERDIGVFYNGNSSIDMNAGFVTLGFTP